MDHDTLERLPTELKLQYMLGYASKALGRAKVRMLYQRIRPLVEDMAGQGPAAGGGEADGVQPIVGDAADPGENYWGGVWRIHRAD